MEDYFRYYFYILAIPIGWVLINEILDPVMQKLFGTKKRAKKKYRDKNWNEYKK